MNRFLTARVIGASLLIAAVFSTIFAANTSTKAQSETGQGGSLANTITVSGFGQASGKPNIATIQLGVEVFNADPSKALATANDTIAKVKKAITDAGVAEEDVQTQNFNLYSTSNPQPAPMQSGDSTSSDQQRTYQAQIGVTIKVRDITKAGAVIDAGIKAGANNVYGLSFGIDDPAKLESDARIKAIANARSRAEELAKALGVKLGDPIIIQEGFGGGPSPVMDAAFSGKGGGGGTQISEGQLTVGLNVQITFAISK